NGTSISSKLIIDSGAGHPILLDPNSDPQLRIPDTTVSAMLGVGLNGPIHGYLGRLNSLRLGDYEIVNPIASFPDYDTLLYTDYDIPRNGNIGNEVLKRFNVVFDYPYSALYLKPNSRFDDPFEHDMSGMSLMSGGDVYRRYFIANIAPGSPADEAGLEINDEILSINLQPTREMSISEIDNLLRSQDKRNLLLEYGREGQTSMAGLVLRRRSRAVSHLDPAKCKRNTPAAHRQLGVKLQSLTFSLVINATVMQTFEDSMLRRTVLSAAMLLARTDVNESA